MVDTLDEEFRSVHAVIDAAEKLTKACVENVRPITISPLVRAFGLGDFNVPTTFNDLLGRLH